MRTNNNIVYPAVERIYTRTRTLYTHTHIERGKKRVTSHRTCLVLRWSMWNLEYFLVNTRSLLLPMRAYRTATADATLSRWFIFKNKGGLLKRVCV